MAMLRKSVSFINCSFTKILIFILVFSAFFWLVRYGSEAALSAKIFDAKSTRALKWNEKREEPLPYMEVHRNSPRISFSTHETLQKLLDQVL